MTQRITTPSAFCEAQEADTIYNAYAAASSLLCTPPPGCNVYYMLKMEASTAVNMHAEALVSKTNDRRNTGAISVLRYSWKSSGKTGQR